MGWNCSLISLPLEVSNGWYWNFPLVAWQSSALNMQCGALSFNKSKHISLANVSSFRRQTIVASMTKVSASLILGESLNSELSDCHTRKEKELNSKQVRTLLIDNYDSYTYNIFQLLAVVNGVAPIVVKNDELTWEYLHHILYEEHAFDNIVISPGPGSPTCAADIGICMRMLYECKDIPILGICLGHQALGYANGAEVIHAPEPVHGRLSEIEHTGCQLFNGIPSGAGSGFKVVRYHSLVLDAKTLPSDLIPIAWTSCSDALNANPDLHSSWAKNEKSNNLNKKYPKFTDEMRMPAINGASFDESKCIDTMRYGKVLMGVMHCSRPHYGVQFHPESIATCHGRKIFENFRNITTQHWLNLSKTLEKRVSLQFSSRRQFKGLESKPLMDSKCLSGKGLDSSNKPDHILDRSDGDTICRSGKGLDASNKPDHILDCSDGNKERTPTTLRLQWKKLEGIATKVGGSANIFCVLFGNGLAEDTFWLDSSIEDHGRARFSFMGGRGGFLWRCITFHLSDQSDEAGQAGGFLSIEDEKGSVKQKFLKSGFFDFLKKELQSFTCQKEDYEGLPFDFCGGYVGYIGYELKIECGAKYNRHKSQAPDACFFLADRLIVIDHCTDDVYILSSVPSIELHNEMDMQNIQQKNASTRISLNGSPENHQCFSKHGAIESSYSHEDISSSFSECNYTKSNRAESEAWMEAVEMKLLRLTETAGKAAEARRKSPSLSIREGINNQQEVFKLQKSKYQYMEDVRRCLQYIKDGESYELCLTTQLWKHVGVIDSLCLYLNLREKNPAPYAAWFNFGKGDICICSSSPERFLRLDQNGILEAKPIKGTVPRGNSQIDDEKLRSQLQHSEKDQAENLMIVDLLRNDLGRVCEPGTVHVPNLMDVESYATVHTLVSTIRGKKKDNVSPVECVRAAFPGGSMTGAPKLRAMEILDSIENTSRGVYSGTIGFFSFNHTFDLNIVIRTILVNRKEASIGAGGAIVALSGPECEYDEMILKARAPINAVVEFENQSYLRHSRNGERCAVLSKS